jgi:hypothetical protein
VPSQYLTIACEVLPLMVIRHGHAMIRGSEQYQEHMVKVNKRSFAIASNGAISLEP